MLDDALRVAERCVHPEDREAILKAVSDLRSMSDALCELRAQGKGNSPQAVALARGIQQKLHDLQHLCQQAVMDSERSGLRKPAPTVEGKFEQAQRWLQDPSQDDKGLGEEAVRQIISEGLGLADKLPPGQAKTELKQLCRDCEQLTNQLADMVRRGQVSRPMSTSCDNLT